MTTIQQSTRAYEAWMKASLGDAFVPKDLRAKHEKMHAGAFPFLRATYWRWAETVLEACPDLAHAPAVLAIGDIHLENYGTWRDVEGRLVWGVNDYDEAAHMPFVLDLVRLATSALLARHPGLPGAVDICVSIRRGYLDGLERPEAMVLDRDWRWLRKRVVVSEADRTKFWRKMERLAPAPRPLPRFVKVLRTTVPEPPLAMTISPRVAGAGSLGRLRLVGLGVWRGAHLVREAKAALPSAWTLPPGRGREVIRIKQVAGGPYRTPDPWFGLHGDVIVRRLSPNNRKIEVAGNLPLLLNPVALHAMGFDLANIHRATSGAAPLRRFLKQLGKAGLVEAARTMAKVTQADWRAFAR